MNKKDIISGIVIVFVIIILASCNKKTEVAYIHNEGRIHGTFYTATYQQPDSIDLQSILEERMREFELSLSTFNPASVISRINRNDSSVRTDFYFETVYNKAREVSIKTSGAFDITVAPLVNAWGFGFGNADRTKAPNVQEILPFIGFRKIRLENHQLIKDDERIMLDASAIAKGYSSDIMAQLLEENGCRNYLIEIGGEIACKGINPKGQKWKIGIDKPIDDPSSVINELQTIISISNVGLATSGNYRQFYYQDGKKYAHTIDPRSGFPVNHNLLSVSVIAPTCMQADAYATAFMVLGVDSSLQICNSIPDMDCYLIYADESGESKIKYTDGFKKYLTQ